MERSGTHPDMHRPMHRGGGARAARKGRLRAALLALLWTIAGVAGTAAAQGGAGGAGSDAPTVTDGAVGEAAAETSEEAVEETVEEAAAGAADELADGDVLAGAAEGPPPALASFGVSAGFPAYRTYALRTSVQYRWVGLALEASYTATSGPMGSVALRGYPPVPGLPVPVYAAVGAAGYAAGVAPFAAVGAHVPLARRWRLDVEAGAAWTPLLDRRNVTPMVSVGASYVVPFDVAPLLADAAERREEERIERLRERGRDCGLPPVEGGTGEALRAAVDEFLRDARATYGSLYTDLEYEIEVVERSFDLAAGRARLRVRYEGSVREIAGGGVQRASGVATLDLRWDGCGWDEAGLRY